MDSKSENTAMGMLAPAKLVKPMNQMTPGKAGRKVSMQPREYQQVEMRGDETRNYLLAQ